MPPPRQFVKGWSIGQPDVVLSMPEEFTIPAKRSERPLPVFHGADRVRRRQIHTGREIHPGNRELVHHVIVFVRKPGQRGEDRVDGVGGGMLCAYAPGDQPAIFPTGTARKITKGDILVFQMHYTPTARRARTALRSA